MKSDQARQRHRQHEDKKHAPETYEILVKGQLDSLWKQWFEGMSLSSVENGQMGVTCTLIAGQVADQSALHGLLIKIRDLNLELLSIRRIKLGNSSGEEITLDLDTKSPGEA